MVMAQSNVLVCGPFEAAAGEGLLLVNPDSATLTDQNPRLDSFAAPGPA